MKLNIKQKKILYFSILTILLMSLYGKKYMLKKRSETIIDTKTLNVVNHVDSQVNIYN